MSSDVAQLAEAAESLGEDALAALPWRLIGTGTQADVWWLKRTPASESVVVKLFRTRLHGLPPEQAARAEFEALHDLYEGLTAAPWSSALRVSCPRPIALLSRGYVMSSVSGVALQELWTRDVDVPAEPDMAGALMEALRRFHARHKEPYADFHVGNVLVGDSCLYLLDPGAPTPSFYEGPVASPGDLLAADVAYWVFSVVTRSPRRAVTARRSIRAERAFGRALLREAFATYPDAPMQSLVRAWLHRYARRSAIGRGPRAKFAAAYAWIAAPRFVASATRR